MSSEIKQKSIRVPSELDARVKALKSESDKSEAATYVRVLEAGASSLESGAKPIEEQAERQHNDNGLEETLKATLTTLTTQLEYKDEQIRQLLDQNSDLTAALGSAQESLKAAQVLQKSLQDQQDKLLPVPAETERKGFFARLFNR